jgi:ribosomal protection tetracycline resistance protein
MYEQLAVDGYNVIHAWKDLRPLLLISLEEAREGLIARLSTLAQVTGISVTVVFDAYRTQASQLSEEWRDGLRVVFTRRGHSADHAIERLAYLAGERGEPLVVVTSDSFHRSMLRGMGAAVIDPDELLRRARTAEADRARQLRSYSRP